jgi:hypothetical protein
VQRMRSSRSLTAAVLAAAWTACSLQRGSNPSPSREVILAPGGQSARASSRVAPAPAVQQAVPVASGAGAELQPPPTPRLTPVSDEQRIYCGNTTCRVGDESCCSDGELSVCVPTVRPRPDDNAQPLASQIEACRHTTPPMEVANIARCDESIDCRSGEACCARSLFPGADANLCVPIKKKDRSPCELHEVCVKDSSCRAPGSGCVAGTCRKPVSKLPCGDAECTAPKSVCCLESMRCALASECHGAALECAHNSDCLKGQYCEISAVGTTCTGQIAWGNAGSVCERDEDCSVISDICKKPVCTPSEFRGIKNCDCGLSAPVRTL